MGVRRTALILGVSLNLGEASIGPAILLQGRDQPRFSTVPVTLGNLRSTVSAAGIRNAVVTVPAGAQVPGTIQQLFAVYNFPVTRGSASPALTRAPSSRR